MLAFPQLASGASVQYPVARVRSRRTVRNLLADNSDVKFTDAGAGVVAWDVDLRALSDAEIQAIANLFVACEGRLQTFTFLDPAANLLAESGDLTKPVWQRDPFIQITAGIADPLGGTRAVRLVNAGQTTQRVSQALAAPGWFQYCLSVYARTTAASAVHLVRSCAAATRQAAFALDGTWRRVADSGALGGSDSSVSFAVELSAGASVELFGLQAEAQMAPSAYMATGAGGVYGRARFDRDVLAVTAQAAGRSDAVLRIVSPDGA